MYLPAELAAQLRYEITVIEESEKMRYVNSIERMIIDEHRQAALLEGRMEGRMEGRQEGLLAGEIRLLAKQLERRFGLLPDDIVSKLNNATEMDLERWGRAVLTAPSLEAVFNDSAMH
jgi:predicted transposase YdaD